MMKKFLSAMAVGAVLSSSRFMVLSNTTLMKPEALVAGGPAQGTATMPFHKASMGLPSDIPSSTSGPLTLRLKPSSMSMTQYCSLTPTLSCLPMLRLRAASLSNIRPTAFS